jgi:hypothetical protein
MTKKDYRHIYRVRLKIAAVLNILEVANIVASVTDRAVFERGKPEYHLPFKMMLFGLVTRCERMLESIDFHTQVVSASSALSEAELAELGAAISAKRGEIRDVQGLLERGEIPAAVDSIAKAKGELLAIARKLDRKIEKRLR